MYILCFQEMKAIKGFAGCSLMKPIPAGWCILVGASKNASH